MNPVGEPDTLTQRITQFLKRALGETILGRLDYLRSADVHTSFGGPLNGSLNRQVFVQELVQRMQTQAIVETGTYRGTTTAFFASIGKPVFSVELNARFHGYARERLRALRNVRLSFGDSRTYLLSLIADVTVPRENVLFYLDAHWNADLPIRQEVAIIFEHWKDAAIFIDDFRVPDDEGYQYDDYGASGSLTLDYLSVSDDPSIRAFFPVLASQDEIGLKRGWVVLGRDPHVLEALRRIGLVREHNA
jgi:hypothetical protein